MSLTAAQIATLTTELQNDPYLLGYSPFVSVKDYGALIQLLTWTRDGATPPPANGVLGPSSSVTAATNASPIQITTGTNHKLSTGDYCFVSGVTGNTAANSAEGVPWKVTKVSNTAFTLNGSTGNGAYVSGGTVQWGVYGVRNGNVTTQQLLGAIDRRDLITNGGASALTADQYGKLMLFKLVAGDGIISLVNDDGSDNLNLTNIKQVVNDTQGSQTRVVALSKRLGSRIEQLLGLSGIAPTEADLIACIG